MELYRHFIMLSHAAHDKYGGIWHSLLGFIQCFTNADNTLTIDLHTWFNPSPVGSSTLCSKNYILCYSLMLPNVAYYPLDSYPL